MHSPLSETPQGYPTAFAPASLPPPGRIAFGLPPLDRLLVPNGLVTLRCPDPTLLFWLVVRALVRVPPGPPVLYLHFLDYHARFWTIKLDALVRAARRACRDPRQLLEQVLCVRAFSRDQAEEEGNWERIARIPAVSFVVVDSIGELYELKGERNQVLTLGKLNGLCARYGCAALVLDYSSRLHPFLGDLSAVILQLQQAPGGAAVEILKHPSLPEGRVYLPLAREEG
ncbi:MAG: hypothetical protein HY520_01555 [Candidatus Aenigmarchaeota archaeon]|nr:hypothetical protein [Candidatus Aenigmarchaeota archaeon]